MKLLAIETSSRRSSVAVIRNDEIFFSEHFFSPRRETGPLFQTVAAALAAAGRPDQIVVGTGPGSYSGIRAGIALAQGLGLALGAPVAGVSSALALPPGRWLILGDARAGQIFFAAVEDRRFVAGPTLAPAGDTPAIIDANSGFSPVRIGELRGGGELAAVWPAAEHLAQAAAAAAGLEPPAPLYLKPPHITVPRSNPSPTPAQPPR